MFNSPYIFGIRLGELIGAILIALVTLGAIAMGIVLSATVFSKKNDGKYKGFMGKLYDLVNFKKFAIEPLVRATYITLVIYITLEAIMCFPTYGFWTGLGRFALTLVVGNAVLRIVYELIMLLVKGVRSLNAIKHSLNADDKDAPEFMESLITPKSSAPAPMSAPMTASAPMPAPAPAPTPMPTSTPMPTPTPTPVSTPTPMSTPAPVSAPISAPMPAPVPVSEPASIPSPTPEPVSTSMPDIAVVSVETAVPDPAPISAPAQGPVPEIGSVSQPAQSDENATAFCSECGREIRAKSRFCPYCGSKRDI